MYLKKLFPLAIATAIAAFFINTPKEAYPVTTVLTDSSYELLCKTVQAEAGNQSSEVKEAVTEVILNRMYSTKFPDTIESVIYQENQFSVTTNGMLEKAIVDEETYQAVTKALEQNIYPDDVLFFNSVNFFSWANDFQQLGDLFFSSI